MSSRCSCWTTSNSVLTEASLSTSTMRHVGRFPLDGRECYPGAGHALNPGYVGLPMGSTILVERPDGGVFDLYGGSPQANGQGARAAWKRTREFLEAALKR